MQFAVGQVAAVAAGIHKSLLFLYPHQGPVIVAAKHKVYALDQLEDIHSFRLRIGAVSLSGTGVNAHDDHIGMLLGTDGVHILLHPVGNAFKVHSAPDFFGQPGLDIGVFITQDGNLEASLVH